jgi:hypothetical protein
VALEELSGGITNLNYKATTPSGTFVIRLFGRDSELLAIDRETEQAATSMAARLGIGPEVAACAPREGYLVTRLTFHGRADARTRRDGTGSGHAAGPASGAAHSGHS